MIASEVLQQEPMHAMRSAETATESEMKPVMTETQSATTAAKTIVLRLKLSFFVIWEGLIPKTIVLSVAEAVI